MRISANLLDFASLFLWRATPAEIEDERQRLEALHKMNIDVFEIEHPTHSGTVCTRISWQEV